MHLSPGEQNNEIKIIEIKNPLQAELIEEQNIDPVVWIIKYAEKLDEILRKPELRKLFDPSRHEELKQKIKDELYR